MEQGSGEPVWFVRAVLLLFFVGFAGYLARLAWVTFGAW